MIKYIFKRVNSLLYSIVLKLEHNTRVKHTYLNERSIEYGFALKNLLEHKAMDVLDVGSGTCAFPAVLEHCGYNIVASDVKGEYWNYRYTNRHIHIETDDITNSRFAPKSFDAITCLSVLEHIGNYQDAMRNMGNLLKDNGILIISFPYTYDEYCDNVYRLDSADAISRGFKYIARSFSDNVIKDWEEKNNLKRLEIVLFRGWTGKFWRSGERIKVPEIGTNRDVANGICILYKRICHKA